MKTIEDLKAAFAGESQANRRYLAYAKAAADEGYPQVAKLFRAVAAAETIHAHNHLRALGEIRTTAENIATAMEGENYEVVTMYPEFIADAQAEEQARALKSFNWAWEVEKMHEQLYKAALESLGKEGVADPDYWICPICGYTHTGSEPPAKCPLCSAKGESFTKID